MIRIIFSTCFLTLVLSCNNSGEKRTETVKTIADTLISKKVDNIKNEESHYLVPDSISTLYETDYYSTKEKKYYYTQKEINGELKNIVHDYMDIDRFLINGKVKQYTPYDSLISKLGTPDSYKRIEDIEYQYSIYSYDGLKMTMHDYDSLVYCDMVDFKDNSNYIINDSLRFDSKTTIDDFVKLYPLSCLNVEKERLYSNEIKCDWVRFEPKGDYQRDDQHIFLFEKGLLRFYIYFNGDD